MEGATQMKKKILILSAFVICLSILAAGTLAYYTSQETAHNVITSGGVTIELVEKTVSENGDTLVEFPQEGLTGIMPGMDASKIVSVKNLPQASEAWIRVKVEMQITAANGEELPLSVEKGQEKVDIITFDLGKNWELNEDGWYYYTDRVPGGTETEKLFESVHFAKEMDNPYQGCTAKIIITAQAVQTANNGTKVSEAQGWPAESAE